MSTEVDRARGLEREGILTDRVRWNLSTAVLYEEAVRRNEGVIAASGPLACRTGLHTGAAPPAPPPAAPQTKVSPPGSQSARARSRGGRSTARWSRLSSTRCTRTC